MLPPHQLAEGGDDKRYAQRGIGSSSPLPNHACNGQRLLHTHRHNLIMEDIPALRVGGSVSNVGIARELGAFVGLQ